MCFRYATRYTNVAKKRDASMHHGSEIRERDKERQREPKRAKESQREFKGENFSPLLAAGLASTASFLSSPSSYVILTQKPQELDVASLPRDRLSGRPFSIEYAYHLAGLMIGQATLLFQRFIHRLDSMRSLLYRL